MRLEYFKYLATVAQTQSISLAAERLFISHQALSKALKTFEDELHVKLLLRTPKGVTLTPAGQYVLEASNKILNIVSDLEYHFSPELKKLQTGEVQIMSSFALHNWIIPKYASDFQNKYPNILVATKHGTEDDILTAVESKEIDLGFLMISYINNQPSLSLPKTLEFVPFQKSKYYAICSPLFPLAQLETVTIKQLSDYSAIVLSFEDTRLHSILDIESEAKKIMCPSYMLLSEYLDNYRGYSLITDFFDVFGTEKYSHIPIVDNIYSTLGFVYNKKSTRTAVRDLFLDETLHKS